MSAKLSPTMLDCVEMMRRGGSLERLPGGYWTAPNTPRRSHDGVPVTYHGATTVAALVQRGVAEYVEWKEGRSCRFPIRAALKPSPTPEEQHSPVEREGEDA